MDFLNPIKPLIAELLLPPTLPMVTLAFGLVLAGLRRRSGWWLSWLSAIALWLVCCNAVAVWMAQEWLDQTNPLSASEVAGLSKSGVQAVVVLGGGTTGQATEYGGVQPSEISSARLQYGVWLARQTGLPMVFAGGVGWDGMSYQSDVSEAALAQRQAQRDFGYTVRWIETQSKDTRENARYTWALLKPQGITRVAIVTNEWHMPRAQAEFEAAGFEVTPAPMGFIGNLRKPMLEWMPSALGLYNTYHVSHEVLGMLAMRLKLTNRADRAPLVPVAPKP